MSGLWLGGCCTIGSAVFLTRLLSWPIPNHNLARRASSDSERPTAPINRYLFVSLCPCCLFVTPLSCAAWPWHRRQIRHWSSAKAVSSTSPIPISCLVYSKQPLELSVALVKSPVDLSACHLSRPPIKGRLPSSGTHGIICTYPLLPSSRVLAYKSPKTSLSSPLAAHHAAFRTYSYAAPVFLAICAVLLPSLPGTNACFLDRVVEYVGARPLHSSPATIRNRSCHNGLPPVEDGPSPEEDRFLIGNKEEEARISESQFLLFHQRHHENILLLRNPYLLIATSSRDYRHPFTSSSLTDPGGLSLSQLARMTTTFSCINMCTNTTDNRQLRNPEICHGANGTTSFYSGMATLFFSAVFLASRPWIPASANRGLIVGM